MGKTRYINTKFWDDDYIVSLSPTEKLLYLYLLTNPNVEISGAYEITLRRIAFETGIEESFLKSIIEKFTTDGRILFKDGWMVILNFIKNQALNPNVEKGIARTLENTPKWVRDAIAFGSLRKPSEGSRTELNLTELDSTELNLESIPPKIETVQFFQNQEPIIQELVIKGLDETGVRREIKAFVNYWTELNSTGKKQRWQLQPVFEVKRRLATWFGKANQFKNNKERTRKIWSPNTQ